MREIKFRAWDIKNKRMFVPSGLKNPVNFMPNVEHMQYTGLKDKNGVEIYEGDIYKVPEDKERCYRVTFEGGAFCGSDGKGGLPLAWDADSDKADDEGGAIRISLEWVSTIEVIGNIYENPELSTQPPEESTDNGKSR